MLTTCTEKLWYAALPNRWLTRQIMFGTWELICSRNMSQVAEHQHCSLATTKSQGTLFEGGDFHTAQLRRMEHRLNEALVSHSDYGWCRCMMYSFVALQKRLGKSNRVERSREFWRRHLGISLGSGLGIVVEQPPSMQSTLDGQDIWGQWQHYFQEIQSDIGMWRESTALSMWLRSRLCD